jgi:hypothetical protein
MARALLRWQLQRRQHTHERTCGGLGDYTRLSAPAVA